MAIIDPKGLLHGERLAACSDNAQNWWPRLFLAANGYARIELSYSSIVQECFAGYRKKPTEDQLWDVFEEYSENHLVVIYEADGLSWAQFITPEKCLRRYKTKADNESPAPPDELVCQVTANYLARKKTASFRRKPKLTAYLDEFPKSSENLENVQNISANFGLGEGVGVGVGEKQKQLLRAEIEHGPALAADAADVDSSLPDVTVKPRETRKQQRDRLVRVAFSYYCQVFDRSSGYTLSDTRRHQGEQAVDALLLKAKAESLPEDVTESAILGWLETAIHRMADSDFHNGKNDRRTPYNDWENLFRSRENKSPDHLTDFWLNDAKWGTK